MHFKPPPCKPRLPLHIRVNSPPAPRYPVNKGSLRFHCGVDGKPIAFSGTIQNSPFVVTAEGTEFVESPEECTHGAVAGLTPTPPNGDAAAHYCLARRCKFGPPATLTGGSPSSNGTNSSPSSLAHTPSGSARSQASHKLNSIQLSDLVDVEGNAQHLGAGASGSVSLKQLRQDPSQKFALKVIDLSSVCYKHWAGEQGVLNAMTETYVKGELELLWLRRRDQSQTRYPVHLLVIHNAFFQDQKFWILMEFMEFGSMAHVMELVARYDQAAIDDLRDRSCKDRRRAPPPPPPLPPTTPPHSILAALAGPPTTPLSPAGVRRPVPLPVPQGSPTLLPISVPTLHCNTVPPPIPPVSRHVTLTLATVASATGAMGPSAKSTSSGGSTPVSSLASEAEVVVLESSSGLSTTQTTVTACMNNASFSAANWRLTSLDASLTLLRPPSSPQVSFLSDYSSCFPPLGAPSAPQTPKTPRTPDSASSWTSIVSGSSSAPHSPDRRPWHDPAPCVPSPSPAWPRAEAHAPPPLLDLGTSPPLKPQPAPGPLRVLTPSHSFRTPHGMPPKLQLADVVTPTLPGAAEPAEWEGPSTPRPPTPRTPVMGGATIPEPILACVARAVLQALKYIHGNHRVHRDLKPGNILFGQEGNVKVGDFGIVASVAEGAGGAATPIGTWNYRAPESLQRHGCDAAADIWALGVTLLSSALGHHPFRSVFPITEFQAEAQLSLENAEFPIGASPEFVEFASLCLQLRPKDRPPAEFLLNHPFIRQVARYSLKVFFQELQRLEIESREAAKKARRSKREQLSEYRLRQERSRRLTKNEEVALLQHDHAEKVRTQLQCKALSLRRDPLAASPSAGNLFKAERSPHLRPRTCSAPEVVGDGAGPEAWPRTRATVGPGSGAVCRWSESLPEPEAEAAEGDGSGPEEGPAGPPDDAWASVDARRKAKKATRLRWRAAEKERDVARNKGRQRKLMELLD